MYSLVRLYSELISLNLYLVLYHLGFLYVSLTPLLSMAGGWLTFLCFKGQEVKNLLGVEIPQNKLFYPQGENFQAFKNVES